LTLKRPFLISCPDKEEVEDDEDDAGMADAIVLLLPEIPSPIPSFSDTANKAADNCGADSSLKDDTDR
jgi:hypothetical protein